MATDLSEETQAKWRNLVERLVHATLSGKLDWTDGAEDGSIVTIINDNIITLMKVEADYLVTLSNSLGDVVDYFTDVDVGQLYNGENAFTALRKLYVFAKRRISGADQIINEILAGLPEHPDDIPF